MPTTNRPFFANFFAAFRAHSALQKASQNSSSVGVSSSSSAIVASNTTSSVLITSPSQQQHHHHHQSQPTKSSPSHSPSPSPSSAPTPTSSNITSTSTAVHAAAAATFRSSRPVHIPHPSSSGPPGSRASSAARLPHHPHHHHPAAAPLVLPTSSHMHGYGSPAASPPSPASPISMGATTGGSPFQRSRTPSLTRRDRRGSDSSSEGFSGAAAFGGAAGPGATATAAAAAGASGSPAEKWYIGGRTAAGEERFYKLGLVRRYRSADRLSLDRLSL